MLRSSFNCSSVRSASISDTTTSSSRSTQLSLSLQKELNSAEAELLAHSNCYGNSFYRHIPSNNSPCSSPLCSSLAHFTLYPDHIISPCSTAFNPNKKKRFLFGRSTKYTFYLKIATCIEFHQTIDYSVQLLMVSFYLGLFYRGFRYDYDYEGGVAVAYRGDVAGYDFVGGDYFAVFVAVNDLPFSRSKRRLATRWAAPPTVGRLGPNGPRRPAKFEDELMRCKDLRPLDTSRLAGNLFLILFFRAIEKTNMCIKCLNGINAAIFYRLDPDIDNTILIRDTTHLAIENNLKEA
uniref:Uncharacterized protein n=1 Tax=Glossina austeni TaxID=7395 RepID=A0A1A9VPB4_GLOAU